MDQHDYDILCDAYDGYEEVFVLYQSFSRTAKSTRQQVIHRVNQRLARLKERVGLEFAVSDSLDGDMTRIEHRSFSEKEIVDALGHLAGPPYYYVHLPATPESAALVERLERIVAGKPSN